MAAQYTELESWLTRFVLEVCKTDGTEYPPNTLQQTSDLHFTSTITLNSSIFRTHIMKR